MSENSLLVGPAIEPFAGGVIGLGLGYTMAPRKYSLKKMLIMNQKKLSEIYSDDVVKQMNSKERQALDKILKAKEIYRSTRTENAQEIKRAARLWHDEFTKVEVPKNLEDTLKESKTKLQEAIKKENYVALNQKFRQAKEALKKAPDNENNRQILTAANEALAAAKVRISAKIEHYSNAVKNLYNERLYNIKSNPAKWADVKEAYNKFLIALAKRRTIASNKLFELSNDKSLIKSYNTIKSFLPKARTKSALTGGLILGGITTLVAARLNPSYT